MERRRNAKGRQPLRMHAAAGTDESANAKASVNGDSTTAHPLILLASTDSALREVLDASAQRGEFTVDTRMSAGDAVTRAFLGSYDVLILDLLLGGAAGIETVHRLRQAESAIPILIVAASAAVADRVHCLEAGGDDCVDRDVDPKELVARVRALVRRRRMETRLLKIGDLEVDLSSRKVLRSGGRIELTATEFSVLSCLARLRGQWVSRSTMLERVWGSSDASSNVVDVYIGYLRRKIDDGFPSRLIHTGRGLGYMLAEECEA